ncbi:Hypothetical_protein [Hexamita inflata]|uniref:Hypothetical_protein n=1 Tax=Hexamita inflata TaxID=28002 RepID=A0AA86PJ17_9EUKA|nr:Hypothetical protein HINF_LOCUS27621 [Hexamita inflata]
MIQKYKSKFNNSLRIYNDPELEDFKFVDVFNNVIRSIMLQRKTQLHSISASNIRVQIIESGKNTINEVIGKTELKMERLRLKQHKRYKLTWNDVIIDDLDKNWTNHDPVQTKVK